MNRNMLFAVLLLVLTILLGMFGYRILVGDHISFLDCFYMTIITISTVGFGEIFDLSGNPGARIFTLLLILIGMGNLLFVISTFTSMIINNQLHKYLWRRKIMTAINSFSDHFIVCGVGNTGLHIINELIRTKREFIAIENNPEVYQSIREKYPNLLIIEGDATNDQVLINAGIEKAKGIACILPTDKDNLFLTVTSKQLNPNLRIIAKVINLENKAKLERAGAASIVPPNFIGALRLVSELIRPKVVGFLDIMLRDKKNLRIEEIVINETSWIVDKTLKESKIREKTGLQIIAIVKKDEDYNYYPGPNDKIETNDCIIVIGEPDRVKKLKGYIS